MAEIFRFLADKIDDRGDQQLIKGRGHADDEFDRVHRVMPYGLSSNPPAGSHGIGLAPGGYNELLIALGVEDPKLRQRNLPTGATALYDSKGNVVSLVNGDGLKIKAVNGNVVIDASGRKVFLGGDGAVGAYAAVMTESGPSPFVSARIG